MTSTQMPSAQSRRFVPGQPDMWAFALFETLLFTSYFAVYLFNRAHNEELYLQSQSHLELWVGVLNTIVLLTSSWSIARCVQAARAGSYRDALSAASLTAGFGALFLVCKVVEWARLIRMGNTLTTNDFFMHYFFLTGLHCLHLLIGFVVLGVIVYQLRGPARRCQTLVETCATYWHTVDLLWVLIFALLYVVR